MKKEELRELIDVVTAVSVVHEHLERLNALCIEFHDELEIVIGKKELEYLQAITEAQDRWLKNQAQLSLREYIRTD